MDEESGAGREASGYRVITLNRPQRLNAFTIPMHQALAAAIAEAEADRLPRAAAHRRGACLLVGSGLK